MLKRLIISFVIFIFYSIGVDAQHISDNAGKKYYDEDKTQLKEVYSYKEVNVLNPREPDSEVKRKSVKHGPYFKYYKSGKLEIAGHFKDGKKNGKWKYYSEDGKIQKVEHYQKGKLIKTNKDPEQPEEAPENAESMEEKIEEQKTGDD